MSGTTVAFFVLEEMKMETRESRKENAKKNKKLAAEEKKKLKTPSLE